MNEVIMKLEEIDAANKELQEDVKALGIRIRSTNVRIDEIFKEVHNS